MLLENLHQVPLETRRDPRLGHAPRDPRVRQETRRVHGRPDHRPENLPGHRVGLRARLRLGDHRRRTTECPHPPT